MNLHPITKLFPAMSPEDFAGLVADIREHGQREPIWTYRDEVIDGAHRLAACRELGIPVRRQEWDGKGSLTAFVISLNLKRRQLTASQKSMVGAAALPMFEAEAKERQGKRTDLEPSGKNAGKFSEAREQAAKAVGVSPRYVQDAKRVARSPELAEKVRSGAMTLPAAVTQLEPARRARKQSAVTNGELRRFPRKPRGDQFERTVAAIEAHVGTLVEIYQSIPADEPRRKEWLKQLASIRRSLATISHRLERKVA